MLGSYRRLCVPSIWYSISATIFVFVIVSFRSELYLFTQRPNENEDLSQAYWIARGGAVSEAAIGIRLLARDLVEFASSRNNSAHDRPWKVIIDIQSIFINCMHIDACLIISL
jgi:hypothetical protein